MNARRWAGFRSGASAAMLAGAMWGGSGGVAAQEVRWSGSVAYTTGSYIFDAPTRTLSWLNGLTLDFGRVDFGASLPIVAQNSHLVSLVGGIPLPTGGEDAAAVRSRTPGQKLGTGRGGGTGMGSGQADSTTTQVTYQDAYSLEVGDPMMSASVGLVEDRGVLRSVRVQGSGKVPLRDIDSGVGTGAWDWGLGASAFAGRGSLFVFADATYWWFGDLPDLEIRDGLTYGAGATWTSEGAKVSLSASYFAGSKIIETMEAPRSVGLGVGFIPRVGRSVSAGVMVGLSESSPDVSAYFGWSLTVG